ncbi:MAG: hypothetical protein CMJ31_11475 [Phycisphaerae bacterium]|nr:hypothetical protein [Phycisphaerae bacterium]
MTPLKNTSGPSGSGGAGRSRAAHGSGRVAKRADMSVDEYVRLIDVLLARARDQEHRSGADHIRHAADR